MTHLQLLGVRSPLRLLFSTLNLCFFFFFFNPSYTLSPQDCSVPDEGKESEKQIHDTVSVSSDVTPRTTVTKQEETSEVNSAQSHIYT